MPPTFTFVRHGEALHNVAFHLEGPSSFKDEKNRDARLTVKGVEQAMDVAKTLSSLKVVAIWSSPLTRCLQTAEEIFEELDTVTGNTLYVHDNLLERQGNGNLMNERRSKTELKKEFSIWDMKSLPDLPPCWANHESDYTLRQRMFMLIMLLTDIYSDCNEDSHILIVGHSDAIATLTGKHLNNAEYVSLTLKDITT
jgi:broad specificity phosphatase PhoE